MNLGGRRILDDVSFELGLGESVAVLGPSGAGKSTLFQVLAGELKPAGGEVRLLGRVVTTQPLWRRAQAGLGYVPQTPSVLLDLTVGANLRTFATLTGSRLSAAAAAQRVGLQHRLAVRARDLSGGERRRLELLRALMGRPRVLLCDEPLSGIDPGSAQRVGELLGELVSQGTSLLLADHRLSEALTLVKRAMLLVDGRIELTAPSTGFLDRPEVRDRLL